MYKFLAFIFIFLIYYTVFSKPKVVVFYSVDCPMCIRETLTIRQLQTKHPNIAFELIFSNTGTTQKQLYQYKKKYLLNNCRLLLDSTKFYKKKFKAIVTPEVFFISENNQIIYKGAINNSLKSNQQKRVVVNENYLEDAILCYLNKKNILLKQTKAFGCLIE